MKKNFVLIILAIVLLAMPLTAYAVEETENPEITANPSGGYVKFNEEDIIIEAYLIEGSNFVKLEDMAKLLKDTKAQFKVELDEEENTVTLTPGEGSEEAFKPLEEALSEKNVAVDSEQVVKTSDGKVLDLKGYVIDGKNYYRIREIGKALGFGVGYDWTKNTILIDSENPEIEDYKVVEEFEAPINKIETSGGVQDITFMIYGFDKCPHCVNLKAYLDEKGIKYEMADIRLNDAKKEAIYHEFYTKFDKEYDRVYYPTNVITLVKDGESISKATVGFSKDNYDSIFQEIESNTYFK